MSPWGSPCHIMRPYFESCQYVLLTCLHFHLSISFTVFVFVPLVVNESEWNAK